MKRLALLAAPFLVAGCISFSVKHAPGYSETAQMQKQTFSPVFQLCQHLCDLDGPRGRIVFGDFSYTRNGYLGRDHTSFSVHYDGAAATCKEDGEAPLRCSIEVPSSAASELVLDPGCSTGRLDDRASFPLRVQVGTITARHHTSPGLDLSMADERGVAIFVQMGMHEGIDVFTRPSDSATAVQVLGISAIYALMRMRPEWPSKCRIEASG